MDSELKSLLESQFAAVNRRIEDNTNIMLRQHEETRQRVAENTNHIHVLYENQKRGQEQLSELWRTVNGSLPPPGSNPKDPPAAGAPVQAKLSIHDGELAALEGRLIGVDGRVGQVMEEVKEVKAQNARQLQVMGEGRKKGFLALVQWMVKEREGQKFLASLLAGATGLVTAIGTTYAILTGRLPLPTSPVPAPYVQEDTSPKPPPHASPSPSDGLEADGGMAPEALRR